MDLKQLHINSVHKFENIEKINDEFTKVKILVQGIGKNRNMSYMSRENVEKNLSTLSYCPVVGHLIEKEDGTKYMGGHDGEITLTEQGIKFKSLTVPFGVIIKDSFGFEDIEEYGETVTYLTAEAFLWTSRYEEILSTIYNSEVWFGQSMEISVSQYRPYETDSNYTELLDWNYSALCLLGKSDNKNSVEHTEPCFISSNVKPLDFSINSDFNLQMEELKKELSIYFDTLNNKNGGEKMTKEILQDETIMTGEYEENITENTEEIEMSVDSQVEVEMIEKSEYDKVLAELTALQNEFESYKNDYSVSNSEFDELKEFKASIMNEKHKNDVIEVLSDFTDLSDIEEFKALSEKAIEYSNIEDLRKECYAIRGKNAKINFAKNDKDVFSTKAPLNNFSFDGNDDGFGGLLEKVYKK